jgi:hypothetical protein
MDRERSWGAMLSPRILVPCSNVKLKLLLDGLPAKDYICEDGRFPVSASFVKFQTPIRFAAVKQGLIQE